MNENIPLNSENNAVTEYGYPNMNLIQRIIGVIFSPDKVMQSLAQKPRIVFALFLIILYPVVLILSILPMYMEYSRSLLEAQYAKMNIEATEEMINQALNISKYSGLIGGAIGAVAMWFFSALILWVIIKICKGQGGYKQILSVTGYASVISALSIIVTIITTRLTGTYSIVSYTSLAALLPEMKGSFLYGAAKSIELFSIWHYIVIAIGLAAVSKLSKKKVYIIVACIFVLLVIFAGITEIRTGALL